MLISYIVANLEMLRAERIAKACKPLMLNLIFFEKRYFL